MERILVIDTETTGLPADMNAPYTDTDNWPHMLSIAWVMYTAEGEQIRRQSFYIGPRPGVTNRAIHINGITDEKLAEGSAADIVLIELAMEMNSADMIIAHNVEFDRNVIGAEFVRAGLSMPKRKWFCTKEDIGNLLNLPPSEAQRKYRPEVEYKQPRLDELYQFLFGKPVPGRETHHGAEQDAAACAACYWELKKRSLI